MPSGMGHSIPDGIRRRILHPPPRRRAVSLPYRAPARPTSTSRSTLPLFLTVAAVWVSGMLALFQR